MDEILAISIRGREEKARTSALKHQIAVTGETLAQLRSEEQRNADAFETAQEGYAGRIATKQDTRQQMEVELEEASYALSNLEECQQSLEQKNEALRRRVHSLQRDKALLLSGDAAKTDLERLVGQAGLPIDLSVLKDGPVKHAPPSTPKSITEHAFMPTVPNYKPHLYGGERSQNRAVFGGSLGKWNNSITHDGSCQPIGPPEPVELDYTELLSISADLMGHHYNLNRPIQSHLKSPLIARRFGESFGCLAAARVLYMIHCDLVGGSDSAHPVAQLLQLEALGIDCPEAVLRMAQVLGSLNIAGCKYVPARSEEMAIKLVVRASVNLIAINGDGNLVEAAELERLWDLLEIANLSRESQWLVAPSKPLLPECWGAVVAELTQSAQRGTTIEVDAKDGTTSVVECVATIKPDNLPHPLPGDTAVLYWTRNSELLSIFGIETAADMKAVAARAVPVLAIPDSAIDLFNTICAQINDAQYAGGGVQVEKALSTALGQLGRFSMNFRTLLRRTLATGSYASLRREGSLAQLVYRDLTGPKHTWLSAVQQSRDSSVLGCLLKFGGRTRMPALFKMNVSNLSKRREALIDSSERRDVPRSESGLSL